MSLIVMRGLLGQDASRTRFMLFFSPQTLVALLYTLIVIVVS